MANAIIDYMVKGCQKSQPYFETRGSLTLRMTFQGRLVLLSTSLIWMAVKCEGQDCVRLRGQPILRHR